MEAYKIEVEGDINAIERPGKSPMWFLNVGYNIITKKGVKFYRQPFVANKFVAKGTLEEIAQNQDIKRRLLIDYFGGGKAVYKKVKAFDLTKIEITKVTVIHFMGYGVK